MSVVTFTLSIAGADFGTLAKVYALLADPKIRANVNSGSSPTASAAAAPDAPVKRKPGRPPGSGKKAQPLEAPPGAPVVEKRKPGRPRKHPVATAPVDVEDRFSRWHAGQKGANGRGKFFTGVEIKHLLPIWEAALASYQRTAGSQVADLRSVKSWSIARLRRETVALGGNADQEGSPVPGTTSKKGKGKGKTKSRFTALAAAQQLNKKPRGRPRKNVEPSPS